MADTTLITQSLVSRLTKSSVAPLTSREYWTLTQLAPVEEIVGLTAEEIGSKFGVKPGLAERLPSLLERGRALAFAIEELEHGGIWVLTADDERYPKRLRERLGDSAPAILYGVGDISLLHDDGIGIVGSRDIGPESAEVASQVARFAASQQISVVSGGARGVDMQAMNAAFKADGNVIAVLADSLVRTTREPSVRQAVANGKVCLVTPYSPSAPFSAGNAMGRNKIIYALSRGTVVVRSDIDSGGTWAGATEALKNDYGAVWTWLGAGAGPGNQPLVERGAKELHSGEDLHALLSDDLTAIDKSQTADSVTMTLF